MNPVRAGLLGVGLLLVRMGLIKENRVVRTTDLAWPRIVTGIARMSKLTADIAMVGIALGPAAIAGLGFATPFSGLAFALGGGIAGGTISLVSQRHGAEQNAGINRAVKVGALLAVGVTLPLTVLFWYMPEPFIRLIGSGTQAIEYGTTYLRFIGLVIPFAAFNLIISRTLVGSDDAHTPMVIRGGGAVTNIGLNALLIFGFDMGVVGAAVGSVVSEFLVTVVFGTGLIAGRLPLIGTFPVTIDLSRPHFDRDLARQLVEISTPLVLAELVWIGGQIPLLAVVGLFGPQVVAAFVIALRVRDLMHTPSWGFGLASSSLIGQSLGVDEEDDATAYAHDVLRFTVAVYVLVAVLVFIFADSVGRLFVDDPSVVPHIEPLIQIICLNAVFWGTEAGSKGALRASGDTRWPFYGMALGLFGVAIPLIYIGAVTSLGIIGLYLALIAEGAVPAIVTYYRFRSGQWMDISREYRPTAADDD